MIANNGPRFPVVDYGVANVASWILVQASRLVSPEPFVVIQNRAQGMNPTSMARHRDPHFSMHFSIPTPGLRILHVIWVVRRTLVLNGVHSMVCGIDRMGNKDRIVESKLAQTKLHIVANLYNPSHVHTHNLSYVSRSFSSTFFCAISTLIF